MTETKISDRALLFALLNLVGDLAVRITGETPLLCVPDEAGVKQHLYPDATATNWIPYGAKARCPICHRPEANITSGTSDPHTAQ